MPKKCFSIIGMIAPQEKTPTTVSGRNFLFPKTILAIDLCMIIVEKSHTNIHLTISIHSTKFQLPNDSRSAGKSATV